MSHVSQILFVILFLSIAAGCYAAPSWRIVNGENALPKEFPSIVSIQYFGSHFCGGTLLDSKNVLTAAHCIFPMRSLPYNYITVRAGEYDFDSSTGFEKDVKVSRWYIHEKYTTSNHYVNGDDLTILRLSSPIYEDDHIKYATLPTKDPEPGAQCTVAGWGSLDDAGKNNARVLQKANMTIVSNEECANTFNIVGRNNNKNICAGRGEKQIGACKGDSGGPLYCTIDNQQYLTGVISYGRVPCAQSNVPTVFTRLTTYLDWIKNHQICY